MAYGDRAGLDGRRSAAQAKIQARGWQWSSSVGVYQRQSVYGATAYQRAAGTEPYILCEIEEDLADAPTDQTYEGALRAAMREANALLSTDKSHASHGSDYRPI